MPKVNTFARRQFTAELWNYNSVTGPDGINTRTYFFKRNIELDVSQTLLGKLSVLLGEDAGDAMLSARLHKLKNKDGVELYPGGIYVMSLLTPNMNPFGVREGFRATATLSLTEE